MGGCYFAYDVYDGNFVSSVLRERMFWSLTTTSVCYKYQLQVRSTGIRAMYNRNFSEINVKRNWNPIQWFIVTANSKENIEMNVAIKYSNTQIVYSDVKTGEWNIFVENNHYYVALSFYHKSFWAWSHMCFVTFVCLSYYLDICSQTMPSCHWYWYW